MAPTLVKFDFSVSDDFAAMEAKYKTGNYWFLKLVSSKLKASCGESWMSLVDDRRS